MVVAALTPATVAEAKRPKLSMRQARVAIYKDPYRGDIVRCVRLTRASIKCRLRYSFDAELEGDPGEPWEKFEVSFDSHAWVRLARTRVRVRERDDIPGEL